MEAAYFTAAVPEPVRIFGLRLLPLSIGRYRLLRRFDCAFVSDGPAMATMEDLVIGVLICSMPVGQFLDFIDSEAFVPELAKWGKHIEREVAADPYFSILTKFNLFKKYIEDSYRQPKYWEEREEQSPSGAHWSQNLEVTLRSELGYTAEEIEEGPLSKALADFFKHAENTGAIRLMTPEELEQIAAAEAADSAAVAATGEGA